MQKAIIIPGTTDYDEIYNSDYPSMSNNHWIPWLQRELIRNKILCQTPEMPHPYSHEGVDPSYQEWKETFEQFKLDKDSIFIGHSAGCSFLLKYLAENKNAYFKKIIFVAPWLDFEPEHGKFLKLDYNYDISKFADEVHVIWSNDDDGSILKTKDLILEKSSKIIPHEYNNLGHFVMRTVGSEFKDLLKICVK